MSRLSLEDRFWAKVDRRGPDECWPWLAGNSGGYGRFAILGKKQVAAHRFAYELLVGPIADGLVTDHLCRNHSCVNPAHLEPVSNRENLLRGVGVTAQFARKTHCPQGHPYSVENTHRNRHGYRRCRTCKRAYQNRVRARARAA